MSSDKKPNRAWVWYFAFVLIASVAVAASLIAFNLGLQLTPEKLEAEWAKWKQHGPRDYRMTYHKTLGENQPDVFVVTVRDGKVRDVLMNEKTRLEAEQLPYHIMYRMFRDIERFLELDAKQGKKNYVTAIFDPDTGAIRRFVRRVTGTKERIQLDVKLEPLPAGA